MKTDFGEFQPSTAGGGGGQRGGQRRAAGDIAQAMALVRQAVRFTLKCQCASMHSKLNGSNVLQGFERLKRVL